MSTLLTDAKRFGDHVVFAHDVAPASLLFRAATIGARDGPPRVAAWNGARSAASAGVSDALAKEARVESPHVARFVTAVVGVRSAFVVAEAPPGPSLHEVIVQTEAQGAALDAATALHACLVAVDAVLARPPSTTSVAPYVDAASVRIGFDGALCSLGYLPCWPAPGRNMRHAWIGFGFMLERVTSHVKTMALRDALAFVHATKRTDQKAWTELRAQLAEALARTEDGADVDDARVAGLVGGLFPERRARARDFEDELAMISDDELRAIPSPDLA